MPPKNYELGSGTLYFQTPEGLSPLGEVESVEITEERPELDILGEPPKYITQSSQEFTATITLTPETARFIIRRLSDTMWEIAKVIKGFWDETSPRVRHLILHGKPRTRKKNINRALREYKRRHKNEYF